ACPRSASPPTSSAASPRACRSSRVSTGRTSAWKRPPRSKHGEALSGQSNRASKRVSTERPCQTPSRRPQGILSSPAPAPNGFGTESWWAVRTMGRIGPGAKEAIPVLIDKLAEDEGNDHHPVATALARIGPDALPELRRVFRESKHA